MKIKANGIEIFYEKIGTGKPLIMAHGNGETHSIFNKATQKLSEHFCVYLPDTRGHGSSEATKLYHYSDMAEDIFAFITELNIEKPIFCGFSDGAISGLLCELTHPGSFSKMILSGANLNPSGLKLWCRLIFGALYLFNKDDKIRLMLKEPNIPLSELSSLFMSQRANLIW